MKFAEKFSSRFLHQPAGHGLALARQIFSNHGGTISFANE